MSEVENEVVLSDAEQVVENEELETVEEAKAIEETVEETTETVE